MNEHDEVVECKLASEHRWAEMRLEIQRIKDDLDVLKVRLDKQAIMVQDIQQLSTSVALLANSVELTAKNIEKITKRIETLESKPYALNNPFYNDEYRTHHHTWIYHIYSYTSI